MNAKRFLVIVIWLLLSAGGSAMAQHISLDDLRSKNVHTSAKADAQLRQLNRDAVQICIEILKQSQGKLEPADRRVVAFRVLGALRDKRAVNALCKHIELRATFALATEGRLPTTGEWYPAAGALAKIGKLAARDCLWELTKENSAQRRECFCWVIGAVEGPEVGRFVLMLALAKETDAKRKARLEAAVPIFEELFPLKQPDRRNYLPRDERD